MKLERPFRFKALFAVLVLLATVSIGSVPAVGQTTIATGSIQGTITDPQGALVSGAKITVTNKDTGQALRVNTNSSGAYDSGALSSGSYAVRIEAPGFKTTELFVVVRIGVTTNGSTQLAIGETTIVIEVTESVVALNTEQATVQGVITQSQIENLPINGRNFLDLAQLEPGVQIQDGGNFDPTKNGFSSISFGGRFGRTARIELDGIDISDETVGTTTQNVPISAIHEFQISQSSLDLSTELTSSGSVNVATQSGTNGFHGGGFFQWRGDQVGAAIGTPPAVYDRRQYGANLGGPLIKNKLFFFGAWEKTTQASLSSVDLSGTPFQSLSGSLPTPFLDTELFGKLDWVISPNYHAFYRFNYEHGDAVAGFVPNTFQPFGNVDYTPAHVVGLDFVTGNYTHAIRFGYMKFRNAIADALSGSNITNPLPNIAFAIGNVSTSCTQAGDIVCFGPNILAPQETFQQNLQFKYDGGRIIGTHNIRYGVGFNRIRGGGFASFFGIAPAVRSLFNPNNQAIAAMGPFPALDPTVGPASNPLNWPVNRFEAGNGFGCSTESPAFGFACGGQHDNRFQWYIGDSWKIRPNFTMTYGVRYVRDTGRSDSDSAPIPCPATVTFTCTGNLLDNLSPGLGKRINQPNLNFAPQVGFAWDPTKKGKTVIRAGGGLFYENAVFNNVLFDRPERLASGLFLGQTPLLCSGTNFSATFPDGTVHTSINGKDIKTQICGQPVGNVATDIADFQAEFQAASAKAGPAANGAFIGNSLTSGIGAGPIFAPNYRTPVSYQMNVGVQHEIAKNTVVTADYLRNVGVHTLLAIDNNFDGDSRFLDKQGALNAISATNSAFGCGTGTDAASINCAIGGANNGGVGAFIADYANNGLTSGSLFAGGHPVGGPGVAAFPGKNPNFGVVQLLEPFGRSVYNALQLTLKSNLSSPVKEVKNLNVQVAYSLSRFISQATDIDFINSPGDNRNPGRVIGPNGLDRTHQLSGGVTMQLPLGTRVNFISHWYTALPQSIYFSDPGNPEDLFQYDLTGDGTTLNKPVPGSNLGSFGRDIKAGDLNKFLAKYDSKFGNQITPAGQALVSAGLFTQQQLVNLCAVAPSLHPSASCLANAPQDNLQLPTAVPGQVGNDAFFTFDLRLGWALKPIRQFERFSVEPQVGIYNLFNRHNFNGPNGLLGPTLDNTPGATGSINNTTRANRGPELIGLGTGIFALGAPRSLEFGIKVNF
jgi:hypothetical protein